MHNSHSDLPAKKALMCSHNKLWMTTYNYISESSYSHCNVQASNDGNCQMQTPSSPAALIMILAPWRLSHIAICVLLNLCFARIFVSFRYCRVLVWILLVQLCTSKTELWWPLLSNLNTEWRIGQKQRFAKKIWSAGNIDPMSNITLWSAGASCVFTQHPPVPSLGQLWFRLTALLPPGQMYLSACNLPPNIWYKISTKCQCLSDVANMRTA